MPAHTVMAFQFADFEGTWDRVDSENAMIYIADQNAALSVVANNPQGQPLTFDVAQGNSVWITYDGVPMIYIPARPVRTGGRFGGHQQERSNPK